MENVCIKVLSKKHGKKVIKYFKSLGVDTSNTYGDNIDWFYGLFNGYFDSHLDNRNSRIIELPKKLKFPREVMVWDQDGRPKRKRLAVMKNGKGVTCVSDNYENRFKNNEFYNVTAWEHFEEIPQPERMTLEQVCKELGREIEII